jgi:hypothetical protein
MVKEHITGDFTLQARKNLISRYGDQEPIALKDIAAIRGHQSMNAHSKSVKIMDKGGQEYVLTRTGQENPVQAAKEIRESFLPAKSPDDDEPHMVNPDHVSIKGKVLDDDTALIQLPNKSSVYLVDEEFGFGMDLIETKLTVAAKSDHVLGS